MYVIPQAGRKIPDPDRGDHLPDIGREVPDNQYWYRRIDDGDVIESKPVAEVAPSKTKAE